MVGRGVHVVVRARDDPCDLDPVVIAVFDIPLFVVASALAALGLKGAALVSAGWTWAVALPFPAFAGPVGIAVLLAASALGISAAFVMSTLGNGTPLPSAMPNRLVIAGPYLWVRNPMALSGIVQGVAVGLILSSWLVIAYAIVGSLLWNYAIRPLEESDLEERFGDEFRQYRDTVRCWIPRIPRILRTHRLLPG